MADNPNGFENLTHSGLLKLPSKDDKNVSFQIDVWGGNTSLVVFTPGGGKPWKHVFPAKTRFNVARMLQKMRAEPRACREPIMLNAFVEENGKRQFKQMGQVGIGIDDNLNLFIDVAHNDLNGRHVFFFKKDGRFDTSNTSMQEKDDLIAMVDYFIHILTVESCEAERLTSFKRAPGGGGGNRGGNFGGGGNRGNYSGGNQGGGNYGGGGGNRQQSNTFSGGGDDDIHI